MTSFPSPSTLDDPDPDLAAQMGFASFGAQPTARKRKYNLAADAMTSFLPPSHVGMPLKPPPSVGTGANSGALGKVRDGQNGWLSERGNRGAHGGNRYAEGERGRGKDRVLGRGGRRGRGGRGGAEMSRRTGEGVSGSNSTPLGTRLRNGGENAAAEWLKMRIGAGTSPQSQEQEDEEEDAGMPGYVDSTPPGSPSPKNSTHLTNNAEDSPIDEEAEPTRQVEGEKEEVDADSGSGPPGRPPAWSSTPEDFPVRTQQSGSRGRHWDWNALRKGVRNEKGDVVYYDASFVEDPWKDLVGGMRL